MVMEVFTDLSFQWQTDDLSVQTALSAKRIAWKQAAAMYWTGLIEGKMNISASKECAG